MNCRTFIALIMGVFAFNSAGGAVDDSSAKVEAAQIGRMVSRVESELRENILKYWLEHARDRKRGGFYGQVSDGAEPNELAPRGALLTTRILWTFSAAYRRYPDPAYLEMARWAYDDLVARFWDEKHGGLYWSVSANGVPLDARKIAYVQAFGIYGLAEYHLATGEQQPLDRAIDLYHSIEKHGYDRKNRGYFEEFSREWTKSRDRGAGGSAMGSLGQKSQNVHLHLLEGFTNLLRAWSDPELKRKLSELVEVMLTRVLNPSTHHLRLFFEEDWTPQSDVVSYGHDIEFSWLVTETAELLGDEKLIEQVKQHAVKIAQVTLQEGVDRDGGMLAEGDASGIINDSKDWWPQAEATVGFMNAFQLSGDPTYLAASLKSWEFIEQNLVDRKNGEWFVGVSRTGKVISPVKISFWKCCYHNGRACMEMIDRLRTISPDP